MSSDTNGASGGGNYTEQELQSFTVERLKVLLKEHGYPLKGRKVRCPITPVENPHLEAMWHERLQVCCSWDVYVSLVELTESRSDWSESRP